MLFGTSQAENARNTLPVLRRTGQFQNDDGAGRPGAFRRENARRMVDTVIIPRWGDRKLSTAADVSDLKSSKAKHLYSPNQLLTVIRAMFNKGILWACARTILMDRMWAR